LDEIGWRLVEELQRDGRATFSELGRRVSLTPPAVAERVRRMEEAGIIKGYRVELDHEKLGYPVTAFVRVMARGEEGCAALGRALEGFPEVLECHRVTGTESYVVKVTAPSIGHLQALIDRFMPYGDTVTSVVLSSPVTHRTIGRPNSPS
jgi:Lrp/AsnC family leucine-responsive transcriptional regulator